MSDKPGPKEHYGLEGKLRFIQKHIFDLGMCFDKREKVPWVLHICKVPCEVPQYYLGGCCCPCCVAFNHREYLLHGNIYEEYSCCQGKYGKCYCNTCTRAIPHCCLIAEVICCTGCAISGNRFLLNERYQTKDSITETIILIAAAVLSFFGLFGQIIGCWVNGVLNGQHEEHIAETEGQSTLRPFTKWNPKGENNCWEFWKCEPCCGEPCGVLPGLYCAACWLLPCFSLCTLSKFYASSVGDEECTILGHFVPYLLAWACATFFPIPVFNSAPCILLRTATRHNYREINKAGDPRYLFGDCLLGNFCAACATCQELRSTKIESWDWLSQMREKSVEMGEFSIKVFSSERK